MQDEKYIAKKIVFKQHAKRFIHHLNNSNSSATHQHSYLPFLHILKYTDAFSFLLQLYLYVKIKHFLREMC